MRKIRLKSILHTFKIYLKIHHFGGFSSSLFCFLIKILNLFKKLGALRLQANITYNFILLTNLRSDGFYTISEVPC